MLTGAQTNEWMDEYIWPQVIELLLNDALFKLVRRVFPHTDKGIDPLNVLLLNGYISFQLMGIRRLCDSRHDAISMRRLLVETNVAEKLTLLAQLDACNEVCDRASDHIAHTGNPGAATALCRLAPDRSRFDERSQGYLPSDNDARPVPQQT